MQAVDVLRTQLHAAHGGMAFACQNLSSEQLHHKFPSATIQAMMPIYVHLVANEDYLVNTMLAGKPTVWESGWCNRLNLDVTESFLSDGWAAKVRVDDLAMFQQYAQDVYTASDAYLDTLTPDDLDRLIDLPNGAQMPLGTFLALVIAGHAMMHAAELSTLAGLHGAQGSPF